MMITIETTGTAIARPESMWILTLFIDRFPSSDDALQTFSYHSHHLKTSQSYLTTMFACRCFMVGLFQLNAQRGLHPFARRTLVLRLHSFRKKELIVSIVQIQHEFTFTQRRYSQRSE